MGVGIDVVKKVAGNLFSKLTQRIKMWLGRLLARWMLKVSSRVSKRVLNKLVQNEHVKIIDIPSIGRIFNIESLVVPDTIIFNFPDKYKNTFEKKGFKSNLSEIILNNDKALKKLKDIIARILNKENIDEVITQAINEVADKFKNDLDQGCQRSNNPMYGVVGIEYDDEEHRYLIRLFKTDYFSFKVIDKIYEKLVAKEATFFNIEAFSDFERVFPFMACIGVGGILNLNFHGIDGVIIGQRSNSVACPGAWHLSFDETYDPRDKKPYEIGGEFPDILICMKRGLVEELGINIDKLNYKIDKSCFVIIKTESRFEVGLFVYVDLFINNNKELYDAITKIAYASDVDNEYEQVQIIPKNEVEHILNDDKNNKTPEAPVIWHTFELIDENRNFITKQLFKLVDWLNKGDNSIF